MDAQELRNLQEAYMEVYEERDSSHPHWETNRQFKKSEKKNQELISAAQKRREDRRRNRNPLFGPSGKMTKTQREQIDLYDIILSHLLDEGYAETLEQAEVIMVNMSEGWREDIMEGMAMKDFKANRIKLQRKADSDDAKKRGHVDRLTGKPYGTEEAASRRKDIHKPEKAPEREARRRFAENPD